MKTLLWILGSLVTILVSIIVDLVKNPEKIDKWSYLYNKYKIFRNEKTEKNIISKNLDYKISSIAKNINKQAEGIIPFRLGIKWRNIDEIESYVKNDEVIVVLKKEDNCDKNIVETCMAFVPKALLPKSRNSIDEKILKSIDLYMVKMILNSGTYDSAYNYFIVKHYRGFLSADESHKTYTDTCSRLDEIGFFTRILLEEYRRLGHKLYGTNEEQDFHSESVNFLKFLKAFSERKPGEYTKLLFNGQRIKIALIFVAKYETLQNWGINAYTWRIQKDIDAGVNRIFVLSYAQRYDSVVEDVNGFVKEVRRKKDFLTLNKLEKEFRDIDAIRLLKKQIYITKDINGRKRNAKYLVYEVIR